VSPARSTRPAPGPAPDVTPAPGPGPDATPAPDPTPAPNPASAPASAGLAVCGVGKSFTTGGQELVVLRDVDFRLDGGETLAVVGPSGSGKSTLLHVLGTLEPPTAGRVTLAGEDLYSLPEAVLARLRNRRIGFVFQDSYLLPQYSVVENVLLPALAFPSGRSGRGEARRRAVALLERVGLGARRRHRPAELSGGERQRAAIARALLNRPALLLCDEPTGSLDHATAAAAADLLFELVRQEGAMLVIATHSRELAARCGRRLELRDGQCYAT
jgi:lipoprotein-releasing system ATP-binding protein